MGGSFFIFFLFFPFDDGNTWKREQKAGSIGTTRTRKKRKEKTKQKQVENNKKRQSRLSPAVGYIALVADTDSLEEEKK